ncbi:hypothetical protein QYF61_014145 [Mycteria americana]|uniref:Uncharacterized protein n=1 Tax=Mycteria americana TaxID=33587 RepID=A0AAN7SEW4_MYCAM|nr:hypothetical protein QYF61_014145 [Mycteria americana]
MELDHLGNCQFHLTSPDCQNCRDEGNKNTGLSSVTTKRSKKRLLTTKRKVFTSFAPLLVSERQAQGRWPASMKKSSGKFEVMRQGWRLNHFPGQPVPMLDNPFSEVKFPNIQYKPPLEQLEAISSRPITCYLGEETDPHLATTSFQAKQPQFPQPLLTRLVLQTLHQLPCPSLDTLQHLNVFLVVRGPKLNTGFEVRPHQCRVQGHNHFLSPAGHTIPDTSQDAIGLLGHLGTLLAHIQVAVNQHPQVLLCWAAFQPLFPKPVAMHGVIVTQINTPTQLGVICKLTEGALDPFVQIIDKDIKQNWPQHRALGNTTCDQPPTGVNSIHHHSLGWAIQPVLYPANTVPYQLANIDQSAPSCSNVFYLGHYDKMDVLQHLQREVKADRSKAMKLDWEEEERDLYNILGDLSQRITLQLQHIKSILTSTGRKRAVDSPSFLYQSTISSPPLHYLLKYCGTAPLDSEGTAVLALPSPSAPGSAAARSGLPWLYLTPAPGGAENQTCTFKQCEGLSRCKLYMLSMTSYVNAEHCKLNVIYKVLINPKKLNYISHQQHQRKLKMAHVSSKETPSNDRERISSTMTLWLLYLTWKDHKKASL